MKISFIVPVYSVEPYIRQCIESLQGQTYKDIEIILVDDGSPDQSGEICESYARYDERIRVIRQKNQGVSAARNRGMLEASGEWICFIDADDAVNTNLCADFLPFMLQDLQVCFFNHREVKNDNFPNIVEVSRRFDNVAELTREDFQEFQIAAFNRDYHGRYDYHKVKLSTPCKFFRKDFLLQHDIRFPVGVPTGEDCLFNLQVYRYAKRGVFLDYAPYLHRVWSNSVSQKYNPEVFHDFVLLHQKIEEYIKSDSKPERYEKVYAQRCIWSLGFCCLLDYCHPNNPKSYQTRKGDFLNALQSNMGKMAMEADLNNFYFEKRVLFWLIKKRYFALVNILCLLKRKAGK